MVGIVELDEAKQRAAQAGLDLVEISPDARPPVVRIMDFGKFKYEQAKKEKQSKTKSKAGEMKEVRLGRSMKIDPHDVEIRVNQARQFLMEGYRVIFVQNFRGRELAYKGRGDKRMDEIATALADIGRVELAPRLNGKRMSMILVPDRAKVDAKKHKTGQAAGHAAPKPPAATKPAEAAMPSAATPAPEPSSVDPASVEVATATSSQSPSPATA